MKSDKNSLINICRSSRYQKWLKTARVAKPITHTVDTHGYSIFVSFDTLTTVTNSWPTRIKIDEQSLITKSVWQWKIRFRANEKDGITPQCSAAGWHGNRKRIPWRTLAPSTFRFSFNLVNGSWSFELHQFADIYVRILRILNRDRAYVRTHYKKGMPCGSGNQFFLVRAIQLHKRFQLR